MKFSRAQWYTLGTNGTVRCQLCPHFCVLQPGQTGLCRVRVNRDGVLYTMSDNHPVAVHIDPIEKKPIYRFHPGTAVFSVGTAGCNFRCRFCQNWELSQRSPLDISTREYTPEQLIAVALEQHADGVAFTYTEPTIFFEYMKKTAQLAHQTDLFTVLVSNGFINEGPLRELIPFIDAANIDVKSMSDRFYQTVVSGRVAPVLHTITVLKNEGVHVEITNLLIPGLNDSEDDIDELTTWIVKNTGADTPVHFSRYFPCFLMNDGVPTPIETLYAAKETAIKNGLKYVYLGNV